MGGMHLHLHYGAAAWRSLFPNWKFDCLLCNLTKLTMDFYVHQLASTSIYSAHRRQGRFRIDIFRRLRESEKQFGINFPVHTIFLLLLLAHFTAPQTDCHVIIPLKKSDLVSKQINCPKRKKNTPTNNHNCKNVSLAVCETDRLLSCCRPRQ